MAGLDSVGGAEASRQQEGQGEQGEARVAAAEGLLDLAGESPDPPGRGWPTAVPLPPGTGRMVIPSPRTVTSRQPMRAGNVVSAKATAAGVAIEVGRTARYSHTRRIVKRPPWPG